MNKIGIFFFFKSVAIHPLTLKNNNVSQGSKPPQRPQLLLLKRTGKEWAFMLGAGHFSTRAQLSPVSCLVGCWVSLSWVLKSTHGDNQRTAFIHRLWAIPVCLWEILWEILEGLNDKQQKQLGKGQVWDKELSFLTLASLSMIHFSNNKFRTTWLLEQKNEN